MIFRHAIGQFAKRHASHSKQQLRSSVPNILTLANACFGFFSIMQALQGNIVAAAYCILVAAIFDVLDGRVARYLSSASYFGAELDSLCDVVSFCVAPATLLYGHLQNDGMMAMTALIIYLCAGLFRLAKFNTNKDHASSFFSGLPTPMAACFLASIVMYDPWLSKYGFSFCKEPQGFIIISMLISFLMISTIPFPSFKRYKITHRYGLLLFFIGIICAGIGLLRHYPILFFISSSYILITLCAFVIDIAIRLKVLKS